MALPLFGGQTAKATKNLVEFKAGRMSQKGKMVHPDKRKGLVFIYKSDDNLIHFCWKDRTTGTVEDDLIIFPDDADFCRVTQCTSGRVYLMKFRSSNRRFFCWLQSGSEDKDEEYCKKVNEIINGKISNDSESTTTSATPSSTSLTNIAGMDQSQLLEFLSASGGSPLSSRTGNSNQASVAAIQSILSGLPANGTNNSNNSPNASRQAKEQVTASNVINKEAIDSLLSSPETVTKLEQHLPESLRGDPDSLRKTLSSPQFQQALSQFSSAFASGQLAPLIKSLGFSDQAGNAAAGGDFEAFVKAVQEATGTNKKEEVEEMDLD